MESHPASRHHRLNSVATLLDDAGIPSVQADGQAVHPACVMHDVPVSEIQAKQIDVAGVQFVEMVARMSASATAFAL
jgi:hypothetical protein